MRNILLFSLMMSLQVQADTKTIPKDSIYQVRSEWLTQDNKPIVLNDLAGKAIVIAMVYTGCAHACPLTITKVQEVADALKREGINDVKLVLASFDTKRDTPEVLKKYMKTRGLKEDRWVFLSTPKETTARELAVVLGISFKDLGNGDFSHSNVMSYLDENGVVKAKLESLTAEVTPIVKAAQGVNK